MNRSPIITPGPEGAGLLVPAKGILVPEHAAGRGEPPPPLDLEALWQQAVGERAALGKHRRATVGKLVGRRSARQAARRLTRSDNRLRQVLFDQQTVDPESGKRLQPHRPPTAEVRERVTRQMAWDEDSRSWRWTTMSASVNPTPYRGLSRAERRLRARAAQKTARKLAKTAERVAA